MLWDGPSDEETCISRSTYEPPSPDYCPSPSFNWPNSPPVYCPNSPPVYSPPSPVYSPPSTPDYDYAPIFDNEFPLTSFPYDEPAKSYYRVDDELFGKVGLHCYNLQNRTNLEFFCLDDEEYPRLVKFYARDPTREFSIYEFSIGEFLTRVVESVKLRCTETGTGTGIGYRNGDGKRQSKN
ncbi:PREDICTED: spore coat protein SP85-like [Camelina sativa]|uniref:Spore coat protein SP85-like n=1 Tax=Camelina sativa TaxID=90675 RepID=A0ABM1RLB5_CAMSA|nr:PREDICTED: spore coat protein SP85-like [Camelina sativa]